MANLDSTDATIKIDNAAGSITDITGQVNQWSARNSITILDDTGMGDTQHSTLAGLAGAYVFSLNGWHNTTTEAIFGPIAQGTSLTKTVEIGGGAQYLNGEFNMQDYEKTGSVDTLVTWSATFVAQGALNRTSVALA